MSTLRDKLPEAKPRLIFAYRGIVKGAKGKWLHAHFMLPESWQTMKLSEYPASPEEAESSACKLYNGSLVKGITPGVVISIEGVNKDGNTTVSPSTSAILGNVPGEIMCQWAARQSAVKVAEEVERKTKAAAARWTVFNNLESVAEAYRKLPNRNARAAFLAQVIATVTGGFRD